MNGKHRNVGTPSKKTSSRYRASGVVAAVLAVLLAVGGWSAASFSDIALPGRLACLSGTTDVRLTAAPDIAPAITRAAERFTEENPCVDITVSAREPADVAANLSDSSSAKNPELEAWISDSSMWLDVARNSTQGSWVLSGTGTSVARSPVVIALPRTTAEQAGWPGGELGWESVLPDEQGEEETSAGGGSDSGGLSVRPLVADPTRHATGLAGLLSVRTVLSHKENAQSRLTDIVRRLGEATAPTTSALYTTFERSAGSGTSTPPAAVVSEQSVWDYNRTTSDEPAVAVYPAGGTLSLDYPYVLIDPSSMDSEVRDSAQRFRAYLRSETGQQALRASGFRGANGHAGPQLNHTRGVLGSRPELLSAPEQGATLQALRDWRALTRGSRTLVLLDVSGSMAEDVPGTGKSRMDVTIATARQGLALFPADTRMGLWTFSTRLDGAHDYREVASLGPLSEQRDDITEALSSIQPEPDGDTGLYDSILAAYRAVGDGYDPTRVNSVIVLTDGNNDDPDGIGLGELLDEIEKRHDTDHPIPVISIAFGPEIDPGPLRKIASITGGGAYVTGDPAKIGDIFLRAISERTCRPDC